MESGFLGNGWGYKLYVSDGRRVEGVLDSYAFLWRETYGVMEDMRSL